MRQQCARVAKWLFTVWALVTFFLYPLVPIYGWLRPWPEAESALREHGVKGRLVMVGGSSHAHYSINNSSKVQTRTFIAVPDSLRSNNTFTYAEWHNSKSVDVQSRVTQQKDLFTLFGWWLAAAGASIVIALQYMKRQRHGTKR
jgi:hypothetical protein